MPIPRAPLFLTLAGAIPFAAAVLSIHFGKPFDRNYGYALMLTYGAIILSFLGGIQWGFAVRDTHADKTPTRRYVIAVVPSLVAWAALLLPDSRLALNVMIVTYAWVWFNDWRSVSLQVMPPWFMTIRSTITTIVILLLVFATMGPRP
jgi:hypothetical protein